MTLSRIILAATLVAFVSSPALAIEVKKQATVAATPTAAWGAIGDFCGIGDWHPVVAKCELSRHGGATLRTLSLKGGGTIVEKLVKWNDARHSYTYQIVDSPLPVAHYRSTISVAKGAKGTTISWIGSFDAKGAPDDKAREVIEGVYTSGLDSLVKKLGQ